jgi:prevent-host-death family protein
MATIDICDAKTRLSQLVARAAAGDEVVISRDGKPLVRIARLESARVPVRFGLLRGKVKIMDVDAPLPDDVLADFDGR